MIVKCRHDIPYTFPCACQSAALVAWAWPTRRASTVDVLHLWDLFSVSGGKNVVKDHKMYNDN